MTLTLPPGIAVVGLGTSVPGGARHLERAVARLGAHQSCDVLAMSPVIATPPFGQEVFSPFLNAACVVRTPLSPENLLTVLMHLEALAGRVRDRKNGPRTLDLDLLLFGAMSFRSPRLELPHPRLLERPFAAGPAAQALNEASVPVPSPLRPFLVTAPDMAGSEAPHRAFAR